MTDRHDHPPDELHDHDLGLRHDLPILLSRRRLLTLMAVAGTATLVGCGNNDGDAAADNTSSSTATTASTGSTAATAASTTVATTAATTTPATSATSSADVTTAIPEETAGPYPGDGTNGPDVLAESGVVRNDITSSFGTSTTVAEGVPLTINLTLLDTANGGQPLAGAAVYLWHCDREGRYSMYSSGVEDENYLRGVQEADADGKLTFTSIFPGCYDGRWPHIHFEVYESAAAATGDGTRYATSQLALTQDAASAVYATTGYEASVENLSNVSLATDGVFSDDSAASQLGAMSGAVDAGYTVALTVPVDSTGTSEGASGGMGGPPP